MCEMVLHKSSQSRMTFLWEMPGMTYATRFLIQNLINFKCTCLLCIASTGCTIFCMGGMLNVGYRGPSQPGMAHTIANHGLHLLQNNTIWWFNIFFHHFSQKSHPRLGWLVGHHCTHGFIPGWDEHVLPWKIKQHPNFDQLQMHMFLMHCNNGPHNVCMGGMLNVV